MAARWFLGALLAAIVEVSAAIAGGAISALEFGTAINVAGRQRMLTQRMSKEFLLIAKGFEAAKNKENLAASIALFHASLGKLIDGSAADGIPAAPSENALIELRKVVSLWTPFKAVLEENMDKSPIPSSAIDHVVSHNLPLLKQANTAVSRLVDAAKGAGIETAGLQVDIAGRQRMLSQKMSKEVLMIALQLGMPAAVQTLRDTMDLFASSHAGLLRGQAFLGLPETRNICVLQQMRAVSDHWSRFESLLRRIAFDAKVSDSRLREVAELNPVLLREMNNAVTLYVTQTTDCPATLAQDDWLRALRELGLGRSVLWQCGRLFLQVAMGVDAAASNTVLQARFSEAEASLRTVIEGSLVRGIGSPVTQTIADVLISGWDNWAKFYENVLHSVSHPPIAYIDVERSFGYGRVTFSKVREGLDLYLQAASGARASLPVGVVALAGELSASVEQLAFEALMGHYAGDPYSAGRVEAAAAAFVRARGELLHGRPATATVAAVNRTTEVCVLRHMQTIATLWEPLAGCAARFAADIGSSKELQGLSEHAARLYEPLRAMLDLYVFGSNGCRLETTDHEWEASLLKSARLGTLSEIVLTEMALADRGVRPPWSSTRLAATLAEIDATLANLTFGSPASGVPSPPTQAIADQLFRLKDRWAAQARASGGGQGRRLAAGVELTAEAEVLSSLYVRAANESASSVPAARVVAAARQWSLVERLTRRAAELQPGFGAEAEMLRQELRVFRDAHERLLAGTPDLLPGQPGYIPPTTEQPIVPQMQIVLDALQPVKAQVEAIASAGYASDAALMQLSLDCRALAVETERAAQLYGTASQLSQVDVARIVVPLPLTGTWAPGGVMRLAATLAQEIINQQQRILPGVAIESAFIDDKCNDRDGMRGLLEKITSNASYIGLGGMACSGVCASTAIVASSVRLPAVSYGCSATYLSDTAAYPGFVRLGTPLIGTSKLIIELARKFHWTRLEVISDSTNYHAQDPQALVEDLQRGGLEVDWQETSASNWHQVKSKAALLKEKKYREVVLLGDEYFVRSVVCAVMAEGVAKGVTWISSGPKKRGWIQEEDAKILAKDPRCTGAALSEYMQGLLNIRATGMAQPQLADEPLDCLQGYTSQSFLELVEQRLAALRASGQWSGTDVYDGVAGLAADGTCVFAYALRHALRQGHTMRHLKDRGLGVYQQILDYLQGGLSFMGVSGNVSFSGTTKPGDLGVWQTLGNSTVEVGLKLANGTISLDLYGGPSDKAWAPHPPEPPGPQFPWLVLPITGIALVVLVACFLGGMQGYKAARRTDGGKPNSSLEASAV